MPVPKFQREIATYLASHDPARRGLKTHDLARGLESEVEDVLRALRHGYTFFEVSPWKATSGAERWRLRPGVRIVDGEPVMTAGCGVDRQTALCRICGAEVKKGETHECAGKGREP
jgi:hypothetical protein